MTSSLAGNRGPLDLRLAPLALTAGWVTAFAVGWSPGRAIGAAAMLLTTGAVLLRGGPRSASGAGPAVVATLVLAGAAFAVPALRVEAVQAGPLGALAAEGASVRISGSVSSDPVRKDGGFA